MWTFQHFHYYCFCSILVGPTMFSLSELAPLNHHQSSSKLLKPWWEVFMDYLVVLMLVASVLACTEQLSRDRLVCIPSESLVTGNTSDLSHPAGGRLTHLVYQQYVYISQVLYCTPDNLTCTWKCSNRTYISIFTAKALKEAVVVLYNVYMIY